MQREGKQSTAEQWPGKETRRYTGAASGPVKRPWIKFREISDTLKLDLLYTLACVDCMNVNHLSYLLRRELNLPDDLAGRILWHETKINYDRLFSYLLPLAREKLLRPVYPCPVLGIFKPGEPERKAKVEENAIYILGFNGRSLVAKEYEIGLKNMPYYFIYQNFPLMRYMTSATCALQVESLGARLIPVRTVVRTTLLDDSDKPSRPADFAAIYKEQPVLFYYFEAQVSNPESLISNIRKALAIAGEEARAIVIARSNELAEVVREHVQHQADRTAENEVKRIYVCLYKTFYNWRGKCDSINCQGEKINLNGSV